MSQKLGLVTYNLAQGWDLETIIERGEAHGVEAAEFRTTHAHGVEPSLTASERAAIKARCQDSGLGQISLGSTCEYHSTDAAEVDANVETTNQFVDLAVDIGAVGVKVRPNGLQVDNGIPVEQTLEQIGLALRECGSGTERLFEEVQAMLPGARVLRMDRDTTGGTSGHADILRSFAQGGADVLLGSQMVSKGLDFPRVTLVGVVGADQGVESAVAVEGDGRATVVVDALSKLQGLNQLAGPDIAYAQSDPGRTSPVLGGVQPPHEQAMPSSDYLAADVVGRAAG